MGLGLRSSSLSLDRKAFSGLRRGQSPARKLIQEYRLVKIGKQYFDAAGRFNLTIGNESEAHPPLLIECVFEVHVHGQAPINEEFAKRFTGTGLRIVLPPYTRQFVTNASAQMAIPPIVLPLAGS